VTYQLSKLREKLLAQRQTILPSSTRLGARDSQSIATVSAAKVMT